MEQGTRLDSTRMSAAQDVRNDAGEDHALDAAVAALLTTPTRDISGGRGHTARVPLPEPGSPEAKAMFRTACTETDLLSRDAVHGYPDLDRLPFGSWTRRDLLRALEAGEMAPAEYARLYRLAFEREHRINAAALATDVGALQALAFADDYKDSKRETDAELLEIGQAWSGLVAEVERTLNRLEDANAAYEAPEIPRELRVFNFDISDGFPLPYRTSTGYAPYGLEQVEELRATPRMGVFIGGKPEGELLEGGGYRKVDKHAQARAEAIIAAWDDWRAEVDRRERALDIPALRMAARTATEAQDAAALRARALKAHTTRGLIVKAEIAAGVIPWRDRDAEAATRDADDEVGFLYTLVSDALRVLCGRDPQLVRAS